jgi:hypothetical protein
MSTIHQIYCTHCTFGTSALERREGEIAGRVLGYSARAGSLEREELRKVFRHVERYLYYSLPSDTPSEDKLKLDAASAPRRLVFLPSVGGLQVVGQVSYRQKDTSRDQRIGSYFGHLLVSEPKSEPWSVLDCLQLWGAPWVAEDSPTIPFQLKTLVQLNSLRTASRPAIDDGVLFSFLTAPPGQPFDDPQQVIPPRWRNIPRTERVSLLADILRAYFELGAGRRESVLVVVEPSLAALLFYGVARLMPAGKLREEISFSTFEPNPDRLQTSLAATTFHDPNKSDLKPDAYRRPGWVINTFLNKNSSNPPRSKGVFARLVLDKLTASGLKSVDELLVSFQAVSIERTADLELLAEASALLPVLLDPERAASDAAWRNSPLTAAFLNVAIRRQLGGLSANSPRLQALASGLNRLTLLELLSPGAEGHDDPVVSALLRNLPAEGFLDLLRSKRIPLECKAEAIAASIARTGRFPENCPQLWDGPPAATKESGGVVKHLLPAVLARLDLQTLQQLKPPATPEHTTAFMIGLVQAGKLNPAIQALADSRIAALDDEQLIDFLTDHDEELRPFYPGGETHLSSRLRNILLETPLVPEEFVKRLDLLRAWNRFLNNDYEMELWLLPLEKIRREFIALGNAIAQQNTAAPSRWSKPPSIDYHEIGRRLLEAIELAMPAKRYGPDERGTKKAACLREAGRAVLGQKNFGSLDQAFWAAIANHFDGFRWSETQLAKARASSGKRSASRGASELTLSTPIKIIGVVAILSVLGGLTYAVSRLMRGKVSGIRVAESTEPVKRASAERTPATTTPGASNVAPSQAPLPPARPPEKLPDVSPATGKPAPADSGSAKPETLPSTPAQTSAAPPQKKPPALPTPAKPLAPDAPPASAAPAADPPATKPPTTPAQAPAAPANSSLGTASPAPKASAMPGNFGPTPASVPSGSIIATAPDAEPLWKTNKEGTGPKPAAPYAEVSFSKVKLTVIDSRRRTDKITLKMLGLPARLLAKPGAGKNGCVMDVSLSDGLPLAKFRQEGPNIVFAWLNPVAWRDPVPVQDFRKDLCRCVVEIDVDDGGPPIYLALTRRISLPRLHLKKGIGTIDRKNLDTSEGFLGSTTENPAAWEPLRFKLGGGQVYLTESQGVTAQGFAFGPGVEGNGSCSVPGLAKVLGVEGGIRVLFTPTKDKLEFTLECKRTAAELANLTATRERVQNELSCVRKATSTQRLRMGAFANLAKYLHKSLPRRPEQGPKETTQDVDSRYERTLDTEITGPSQGYLDELSKNAEPLKEIIARADATDLSAVLYREVQTDDKKKTIRVESVIIGEPPTEVARDTGK